MNRAETGHAGRRRAGVTRKGFLKFSVLAGVWVLLAVVYGFFGTYGNYRPYPPVNSHLADLGEGFLSGGLHLSKEPSRELLSLLDPYDPTANAGLRYHDASLYNGRFYLYFGPVPALVAVPWRLATGHWPPDVLLVCVFLAGAAIFQFLSLKKALSESGFGKNRYWLLIAGAALVFGAMGPILASRAAIYEVEIAGASFFTSLALYSYFLFRKGRATRFLITTAAFIVLAAGCRPHMMLVGLALLLLFTYKLLKKELEKTQVALFATTLCVGAAALFYYNHARFDEYFEFGIKYIMTCIHSGYNKFFPQSPGMAAKYLIMGLYYNFLSVPVLQASFPYVAPAVNRFAPFREISIYEVERAPRLLPENAPFYGYGIDATIGLVYVNPLFLAGPLLLFYRWKHITDIKKREFLSALGVFLLFGVSTAATPLVFAGASTRYLADFAPYLVLAGLYCALAALESGGGKLVEISTVLLVFWSVAVGMDLGFAGYYDLFKLNNPDL